jgi:hypothetical protein
MRYEIKTHYPDNEIITYYNLTKWLSARSLCECNKLNTCVCLLLNYCSTYYKAVRVGGGG